MTFNLWFIFFRSVPWNPVVGVKILAGALYRNNVNEGQLYYAKNMIPHPQYFGPPNKGVLRNDIALIKVDRDIVFTKRAFPITVGGEIATQTPLSFTGWGTTEVWSQENAL